MESSRRLLFVDVVVDTIVSKKNQIALSPCFTFIPKQVWDYLKQGLVFNVRSWLFARRRKCMET